jgi:hypothetical protein
VAPATVLVAAGPVVMTRKSIPKTRSRRRAQKSWALGDDSLVSPPEPDAVKDAAEIKGILVRTPIATWRQLKHICADHDKSLQDLLLEAMEHVIKIYGPR